MQKYLHDLQAWNALPVEAQELVIGRTKLDDIELDDAVKPADSHVALNTIVDPDGTERKILRDNMPFGAVGRGEFGTYFIGYARTPTVTERMLERMFLGDPPASHDRILDFSTAVTGTLFFVPSADFLDDLPDPPGRRGRGPRRRRDARRRRDCGATRTRRAGPRIPGDRRSQRKRRLMNNLHRELAPISAAAWADLEDEARRTFERHVAGRRIVDVAGPGGFELSAVGTGHLQAIDPHSDGVIAHTRLAQPIVELRVPFTVDRQQVDDVERGAKDADWQPVKDAARQLAFAEDRAIFDGYAAAGITGIRASSSNPPITLPTDARDYPDAISQAVTALRMAGVNGPYTLALSADAYTAVSETSDDGYPIYEHITPSRRR